MRPLLGKLMLAVGLTCSREAGGKLAGRGASTRSRSSTACSLDALLRSYEVGRISSSRARSHSLWNSVGVGKLFGAGCPYNPIWVPRGWVLESPGGVWADGPDPGGCLGSPLQSLMSLLWAVLLWSSVLLLHPRCYPKSGSLGTGIYPHVDRALA